MNPSCFGRYGAISSLILVFVAGCGSSAGNAAASGGTSGASGGAAGESAGSGGAAGGGGAPASCPDGYPLTHVSGKPVVELTIGGKGPYKFVYDTGAPTSGVDPSVDVGSGPYVVEVGGKQVTLDYLEAFPVHQYLQTTAVDGVIGADVMRNFAVTLDVKRMRFWLDDERDEAALLACSHVDGKPAEVSYTESDYLFVPGNAEGEQGWFLVDTGASLGAMPKSVFAGLESAHPRPALDGFYTPAAIGTFWAQLTSIGYLEVAGQRVGHILTRTMDDQMIPTPKLDGPFLGVLPDPYLRHFMLTVDYKAGKIRLDAYAGMPSAESPSMYTLGIGLEQTTTAPVHVSEVLPGSSAEEQGVMLGDAIVSVDGNDFAALDPYSRPWALLTQDAGAKRSVVLERNGQELDVSLEARDLLVDPKL